MAYNQPDPTTSSAISGFLFLILFSAIQLFRDVLASTQKYHVLGGLACSVLFVLAFLCLGNLSREARWIHVIISLLLAELAAVTVHRVSVTACFLFSTIALFYMSYVSQNLHRAQPVAVAKRK